MKKVLLAVSLLIGGFTFTQDCSSIFISEYVEGWGNNKALEIYNPTNAPVDLSDYMIERYSNGAGFPSIDHSVQLQGTLQGHDVYVLVLDKRDPNGTGQDAPVWDSLQLKADGFYCPDYNVSSAMYFNGNDAVALVKGSISDVNNVQLMDLIGVIGQDPDNGDGIHDGWTDTAPYVGVGKVLTTDHSLVRKASIKHGVTTPPQEFNALVQWDTLPPVIPVLDNNGDKQYNGSGNLIVQGNWSTLGNHVCDCGTAGVNKEMMKNLSIFPNPSTDGTVHFNSKYAIVKINVYNSLGKEVYAEKSKKGIHAIHIDGKAGVYIANIALQNGTVTTRRIVLK